MRVQEWMPRLLGFGAMAIALSSTGCKSLNERYISLEVWKYEKCFGHLPPGFVPPGAMAQAAAARGATVLRPPPVPGAGTVARWCRWEARTAIPARVGCRAA